MPTALTSTSLRPSRRSAIPPSWARGCGVSTSTRAPTSGWSRRAARWSASPSGIGQQDRRGEAVRTSRCGDVWHRHVRCQAPDMAESNQIAPLQKYLPDRTCPGAWHLGMSRKDASPGRVGVRERASRAVPTCYGRRTARRGPATNPASTSSGSTSLSATGYPSNRSTASRFRVKRRAWSTTAPKRHTKPHLLRFAERDERAAAALDEECRPAAEQDDVRAGDARRACACPFRPRQYGAVRLSRIGGGEDKWLGLVLVAWPQLAQRSTAPPSANWAPPSPSTK